MAIKGLTLRLLLTIRIKELYLLVIWINDHVVDVDRVTRPTQNFSSFGAWWKVAVHDVHTSWLTVGPVHSIGLPVNRKPGTLAHVLHQSRYGTGQANLLTQRWPTEQQLISALTFKLSEQSDGILENGEEWYSSSLPSIT